MGRLVPRPSNGHSTVLTASSFPVDAIMVGGWDLQSSLGIEPSFASTHHPQFLEAIEKIQRAADANGVAVMGGGMADTLPHRIRLGWRLFICGTDAAGILSWGNQALEKYKEIAAGVYQPLKNGNGVSH
jgi:2-keto-3-deoxy-L-rhamnonate aldolase RhmA